MLRRKKQKGNYAFIDNQNLNVSTQKFGWKMDWRKFRKFLRDEYGVTKAYMFIGYVPEFEEMYQTLNESGYGIVLKPTTTGAAPTNGNGEIDHEAKKPVKGNVDSDLVLWAMKEINNYDKAVLVSGDGDFYGLVEYLAEQEKLLKLLVPSMHYSRLFKPFEKYVERLDHHRQELRYPDRVRKNARAKK
jgi:uncharacterized LabA/DUF88 family protein